MSALVRSLRINAVFCSAGPDVMKHGMQRRIISVDIFFIFLRLLYVT